MVLSPLSSREGIEVRGNDAIEIRRTP